MLLHQTLNKFLIIKIFHISYFNYVFSILGDKDLSDCKY